MNDAHDSILQRYFWDFVDGGDAIADTPLFTGGYRAGIRPSSGRGRVRH